MSISNIKKLALAALFLALSLLLPFLTGQIQQFGNMLLPMHLPILLCGLICGWKYGGIVGFIAPLLRSTLFGMPPMFPVAIAMAFELAVYGIVIGFLYEHINWKYIKSLYFSMLVAMISGRIVWGFAMIILSGMSGNSFTWQIFISGAVLGAIPGIVLQLIIIPAIMIVLQKTGVFIHGKDNTKSVANTLQ